MDLVLPSFLEIRGYYLPTFGIFMVVSIFAVERLLARTGRSMGFPTASIQDAVVYMSIGAMLGARLLNQVTLSDLTLHPSTWLRFAPESFSYLGALVGAFFALNAFVRRHGGSLLEWADGFVPGAALASSLLWVALPWTSVGNIPVHLLGFVLYLALLAFLIWQHGRRDYPGQNLVTFLFLAGAIQFGLQAALYHPPGQWLNSGQVSALFVIVLAVGLLRALQQNSEKKQVLRREGEELR